MQHLLWVCLGGAVGSGARWIAYQLVWTRLPDGRPWIATLAVNLSGSFLIALLAETTSRSSWMHPELRLALATGVLGGFTTYSTFNQETLRLLDAGHTRNAVAYVAATVLGALLAGLLGLRLGRVLVAGG